MFGGRLLKSAGATMLPLRAIRCQRVLLRHQTAVAHPGSGIFAREGSAVDSAHRHHAGGITTASTCLVPASTLSRVDLARSTFSGSRPLRLVAEETARIRRTGIYPFRILRTPLRFTSVTPSASPIRKPQRRRSQRPSRASLTRPDGMIRTKRRNDYQPWRRSPLTVIASASAFSSTASRTSRLRPRVRRAFAPYQATSAINHANSRTRQRIVQTRPIGSSGVGSGRAQ